MKNSFVLYTSYIDQVDLLTDQQAGALFKSILQYAKDGSVLSMDGPTSMAFAFIKAQMDKDATRYDEICEKRKESGKQGGRPQKANGLLEKQKKQMVSEKSKKSKSPPDNDNEYEDEYDNEYDNDNEVLKDENLKKKGDLKVTGKRFTPPSIDEIKAYCAERGNAVDADRFYDFYSSKGWMVGKNKMKDWKAAVRNWERSARQESTANPKKYMDTIADRVRMVDDW